jgi:hypothetical protein
MTVRHDNSAVVDRLENLCRLKDAIAEYPALDDILTGVCRLDYGGNTRPLSASKFFWLLSTMRVITIPAVEKCTGDSYGHAAKIASGLRIASRAFESHVTMLEARREAAALLKTVSAEAAASMRHLAIPSAELQECRHQLRQRKRNPRPRKAAKEKAAAS